MTYWIKSWPVFHTNCEVWQSQVFILSLLAKLLPATAHATASECRRITSSGYRQFKQHRHEVPFSVCFNESLGVILPPSLQQFKLIPYDAYCTTVNSALIKRVWLYQASLTSFGAHLRDCWTQDMVPKLCTIRIAARRQRELVAIIAAGEFEDL